MKTKEFTRPQICNLVDNANGIINEVEQAAYDLLSVATQEQSNEFRRLIFDLRRNVERMGFDFLDRNNK